MQTQWGIIDFLHRTVANDATVDKKVKEFIIDSLTQWRSIMTSPNYDTIKSADENLHKIIMRYADWFHTHKNRGKLDSNLLKYCREEEHKILDGK